MVNFILCMIKKSPVNEYIFLWMALFNFALLWKKNANEYLKIVALVIIMLPIVLIKGSIVKMTIAFICAAIIYLYKQNRDKISYSETVDEFKKCFTIDIFISIVSWLKFNNDIVNEFILPYSILYIVSIIILLRFIRNYEYNAASKKMNKINIIYSICAISTAFILALKSVRQGILNLLLLIYKLILNIIFYVFIPIFSLITFILSKIFVNIHFKNIERPYIQNADSPFKNLKIVNEGLAISSPLLYKSITTTINILLVVLAAYFMIKLLRKKSSSSYKKDECVETKEFIFSENRPNKLINRLNSFLNKGDYAQQIRYYYRILMIDSMNKGVELKESDTTMDIYSKSIKTFNKVCLWNMRRLYLQIRYGNEQGSKEDVREFYKFYKNKNKK